ncbi:MAG: phosphate ABC transporter substrate-binding protein [Gammaproteobacteria bacterium]|nr:MAG: phosphate ABC transporter substrate-binding protein [Gammaproteobacteria bacterium]
MEKMKLLLITSSLIVTLSHAADRKHIEVVGSSTVYPFAKMVAKKLGTGALNAPKIKSTGSGLGIEFFCEGDELSTPDVVNASRRMKKDELMTCHDNGVNDITEALIGYDGIVMASSKKAPDFALTRQHLFDALAAKVPDPKDNSRLIDNPYQTWSQIDASLPSVKIAVFGPPLTSGTRDTFEELVLEAGCQKYDWINELKSSDKKAYKKICHAVREDGAYDSSAGENDGVLVRRLSHNVNALGILGYSFLEKNAKKLKGHAIEGVQPSAETIASGEYPVSRPLYFYVKNSHVSKVPLLKRYTLLFFSVFMSGEKGMLTKHGLIPLNKDGINAMKQRLRERTLLQL